jgi:peroxiredoxin
VALLSLVVLGTAGCNGADSNGNSSNAEPDLASGLGVIVDCDQNSGAAPEAGQRALDFRFEDATGQTFSLSDYRGRAILLNFWSTGCSHCQEEIPYIVQVYNEWPADELVVLTIEEFNDAEAVNTFFNDSGIYLPVLLDSKLEVMEQYEVGELPCTFFIDNEGWIRGIKFGSLESLEELEDILNQLIALQEGS